MRSSPVGSIVALALALLAAPLPAAAEQAAKLPRIGFLYPGSTAVARVRIAAFLEGLRGVGYVEGQHVILESRVADEKPDRLPGLAADLVRLQVDVIVAASPAAIQAARMATNTIPIIAVDLESDPVASGFVTSLARPSGNISGLFLEFPEFAGKWLELLHEAVPRLSRVAVLWDPATGPLQLKAAEAAGRALGLHLQILEVRGPANLEAAFRSATQGRAGGLVVLSAPVFAANMKLVVDLAMRDRLPAIMLFPEFADAGGLMAYGPNIYDLQRRAGALVGKVLQGAKPADLPVERPTRFELVVNLKTPKALGLTIPPSVLIRAAQVIQ